MKLIRVVAPHFVAGFITDGEKVVRAAPILSKRFVGLTEDQARKVIAHFNWKASVVEEFEEPGEAFAPSPGVSATG
jgi:hypothetical protein